MPDTVIPGAQMPVESLQQPATVPQILEHGRHDQQDEADHTFKKLKAKEDIKAAIASDRVLDGFVRVFTCPKCRRRIEPQGSGFGKCPYCKEDVTADSKEFYAGKKHENNNRYARNDTEAFNAGKNLQCMQTTRRIIKVNNGPVKVER